MEIIAVRLQQARIEGRDRPGGVLQEGRGHVSGQDAGRLTSRPDRDDRPPKGGRCSIERSGKGA